MISARQALGSLALGTLLMVGTAWAQQAQPITETFDKDPGWEAKGNKAAPQSFGWSMTKFAGGKLGAGEGELGGIFARETLGYYGKKLAQPVTLGQALQLEGRLNLATDGGGNFLMGWFDPTTADWPSTNYVGLRNDNPRLYLRYATKDGTNGEVLQMDGITLGQSLTFKLAYDPNGNSGKGHFSLSINDQPRPGLDVGEGHKANEISLTHFGVFSLFNAQEDRTFEAYFDDLIFTAPQ